MGTNTLPGTWQPDWRDGSVLSGPRGICVSQGVVMVSDLNNSIIRCAGVFDLDRMWGITGCEAQDTEFSETQSKSCFMHPRYIWRGLQNEVYFTSTSSNSIYKYCDGKITTISEISFEKKEQKKSFQSPRGGCVDPQTGEIYIADFQNDRVCVIGLDGVVSTICKVFDPCAVFADDTGIYIANDVFIRRIWQGEDTLYAGSTAGFEDGPKLTARFSFIYDVKRRNGKIFLTDCGNRAIRVIDAHGMVTTLYNENSVTPFALDFLPQGHLIFTSPKNNKIVVLPNVVPSAIPVSLLEWTKFDPLPSAQDPGIEVGDHVIHIGSGILIHRALAELAYPTLLTKSIPPRFPDSHLSSDQIRYFLYTSQVPKGADAVAALGLFTIAKSVGLNLALKQVVFQFLDETLHKPLDFINCFKYLNESCNGDVEAGRHLIWHAKRLNLLKELNYHFIQNPQNRYSHFADANEVKHTGKEDPGEGLAIEAYQTKLGIEDGLCMIYSNSILPSVSMHHDECAGAGNRLIVTFNAHISTNTLQPNFTLISCDGGSMMVHDWLMYSRWPFFRNVVHSDCHEWRTREMEIPMSMLAIKAFIHYLYTCQHQEYGIEDQYLAEILQNAQFFGLMTNEWPPTPIPEFEPLLQHSIISLSKFPHKNATSIWKLKLGIENGSRLLCATFISAAKIQYGRNLPKMLDNTEISRLHVMRCPLEES